jgi:hypothetical protein
MQLSANQKSKKSIVTTMQSYIKAEFHCSEVSGHVMSQSMSCIGWLRENVLGAAKARRVAETLSLKDHFK